jgi:hypothetical protein
MPEWFDAGAPAGIFRAGAWNRQEERWLSTP